MLEPETRTASFPETALVLAKVFHQAVLSITGKARTSTSAYLDCGDLDSVQYDKLCSDIEKIGIHLLRNHILPGGAVGQDPCKFDPICWILQQTNLCSGCNTTTTKMRRILFHYWIKWPGYLMDSKYLPIVSCWSFGSERPH